MKQKFIYNIYSRDKVIGFLTTTNELMGTGISLPYVSKSGIIKHLHLALLMKKISHNLYELSLKFKKRPTIQSIKLVNKITML